MVKESLATAEQDRHDRDMHLVDQLCTEVLLDRGGPAA
jgi:hypothetical protein